MADAAIVIMAKLPREGDVKTRLGPFLNPSERSALAECFLKDTAGNALNASQNVFLAYSGAEATEEELRDLVDTNVQCFEQIDGDLGIRLAKAVELVANGGCSPVIVVGTDSPMVGGETLEQAIGVFDDESVEIVIGPSEDGGYYLIGLRTPLAELFENISWSSGSVYQQTLATAKRLNIKHFVELRVSYDIDNPDDLLRLYREACQNTELKRKSPETYRWLIDNREVFTRNVGC